MDVIHSTSSAVGAVFTTLIIIPMSYHVLRRDEIGDPQ
jgi:hypothetical protein